MGAPALLNGKELAAALGISPATLARRKDWRKAFRTSRPIGQRQYSRELVERYLAGEALSQFGHRRK